MASLDTLTKKKEEAQILVSSIEKELKDIQSIKDSAIEIKKSISKDAKDYKKTVTTLNRINSSINDSIQKFNVKKTKITKSLRDVNRFYDLKYVPLAAKIEDPNSGLNAKIKNYNVLSRELDKIEKDCRTKYQEVKDDILQIKRSISQLKTIDSAIKKLAENSQKNDAVIKGKLNTVVSIEIHAKELKSTLDKILTESTSLNSTIKTHEESAQLSIDKISKHVNDSEYFKKKIEGIYDIAANTGRSGEFENRRNKLKIEVGKWETRIMVISFVILLLVIGLFLFQLSLQEWKIQDLKANFYLRYLLLSPIVYYLVFSANQHSKSQKLYDKYSFKTTLAMSVQHHIELLTSKEEFTSSIQIDNVLNFILDAFRKIYSEPYSDDDLKFRLKLANLELEIEKKMVEFLKKESHEK
jgi:hypothetical protein